MRQFIYAALAVLLCLLPGLAYADVQISSLPYTTAYDDTTYVLTRSFQSSHSGVLIQVNNSNVTIDFAGYTVADSTGRGSSADYDAIEVASTASGVTIKNGTIRYSVIGNPIVSVHGDAVTISRMTTILDDAVSTETGCFYHIQQESASDSLFVYNSVMIDGNRVGGRYTLVIANNAIIDGNTIVAQADPSDIVRVTSTSTETVQFTNNIVALATTDYGVLLNCTDATWTGLTHSNNRYYRDAPSFRDSTAITYNGTGYKTNDISDFQAGHGAATTLPGFTAFDLSDLTGAPWDATGDVSIDSTSICVDVGDSTYTQVATDRAGNDRVQQKDSCQVDVGAYEYQGGDCGGAGCTLPTANFGGTPLSGNETLTVSFTDSSTATPTSWKWYFGDGDSSTVQNPSHDYTAGGTYSVQLIATNACGSDTLTRTNYITVNNTGACCAVNYTCTVTDSVTCVTAGSTWQGNDVACSPDPCAETVGSCCLPNNVCIVQVEIGCLGTWTSGATCDPGDCGFRGTCDYTITGADLPYNATAAGTYCLDLSDSSGVYQATGDIVNPAFKAVTGDAGRVTLVPYNGWFQDTLRVTGWYKKGLIRCEPPSALTVKGFVIDGTYWNSAVIRAKSDGLEVDSCYVYGGILSECTSDSTDGSNTVDGADNVVLRDLWFITPDGQVAEDPNHATGTKFISVSGRVYGNYVKDFSDSVTIENIYMDITAPVTDGDGYLFDTTALRYSTIDNVTINVRGQQTIGDITPMQLHSIQSSTISNINIYGGIGCDKAMSIRTGTSTETKRPRNLTIRDISSHMETGAGVNIDADSSRVYNVTSYAPGDPLEAGYVFRLSEQAFNDTIENCLFVSTSDDASAIQIEGSPIYTAGNHRIANVTAVAHGTESGNYGKGAVLYIKADAGELDSLWWNNSAMVQTSPNAPIINTEGAQPTYWALEENAFEGGDNFMENDNGTVIYSTLSAFETAYTEASDNIYVAPGAEPILGNATTQDTTGSYGLHYLSPALDIGDSTLPVLGRTTDLAGYDRVVSTNMDPGAYEWFLPGTTGACCFADGTCSDLIEEDCTPLGGTFQGNGTDCNPNPCSAPTGACCVADTTCTVETEADCTTLTGTWFQGTACADIDCEAVGACCLGATCVIVPSSTCTSGGGTFYGDGTNCIPNPCPDPTGACCTAYGCYVIDPTECETDSLGTYIGDDVQCTPDPCTGTTGACCFFWAGTCQVITEADCTTQGGDYQGDGTDCNPNPCATAQGACCATDGSCTITTLAGCSGTWRGPASSCSPNPCPQPTGACCLPDIEIDWPCVVTTEETCTSYEGAYQGNATTCSPDPCAGYGLVVGARFMEVTATTTWIQSTAPTTNHSADSLDQISNSPTFSAIWRFDMPAEARGGTVSDAWIDATLNTSAGGGPWPIEVYRIIPDVVITEATYNEYSSGNSWTTPGAKDVGTDIALPQLAFEDLDTTPGSEFRIVGGYRARHLVRKYLVPDGTVSVIVRAGGAGNFPVLLKGDGTAGVPTLTIVYTLDGRRRTLQILGQ